jgi:hypothetical protein
MNCSSLGCSLMSLKESGGSGFNCTVAYSLVSKSRLLSKSRLQWINEQSIVALANSLHATDVTSVIHARASND